MNNAGIHRAKEVQTFVARHERLSVEDLPPYAPDLNLKFMGTSG
ncbi:transposase [Deinococcus hohokamensis]|uniref:Transposase n=1 Tax=Deinococcus hohokamensis TaxID=309883 RepID=A0ABV9IEP0_9DEIO